MSGRAPTLAGLYGKVPAYGDFLSRGLPSSFVEPWHQWLEQGLRASQSALADRWMEAYLTSPPWRFVLEPGLAGSEGWLGVMASSVDSVNRCYPVTVVIALGEDARLPLMTDRIDTTLDALERIVLQLIDGRWTPDAVMAGIDRLAQSVDEAAAPPEITTRDGTERLLIGAPHAAIASLALRWFLEEQPDPDGQYPLSGWWHRAWSEREPEGLVLPGWAGADLFTSFLDGNWDRDHRTQGSAA